MPQVVRRMPALQQGRRFGEWHKLKICTWEVGSYQMIFTVMLTLLRMVLLCPLDCTGPELIHCTPHCLALLPQCINANRKKAGLLQINRSEMEWLGVPWWMGEEPSPEL